MVECGSSVPFVCIRLYSGGAFAGIMTENGYYCNALRYSDPEDRISNRVISDISVGLWETTLTRYLFEIP